jgi:PKD repeat protein
MKKNYLILAFSFLVAGCGQQISKSHPEETGARQAMERDIEMMKDPSLGYIPSDRLLVAKQYKDDLMRQESALTGVEWNPLGPNNQGGRSRTILIDANDPTGKTIFAASVSGGLWRTNDITATEPLWFPVNDLLGNLAIMSIAQDPVNPQKMYFCTGEGYSNIDYVRGLGVWASTDGGFTWLQLGSTNNSNFYYCQKTFVTSTGVLFVATSTGLYRSADFGSTFTKVLGTGLGITGATSNFTYDIEQASSGDLYASLYGSVHKSTDGGLSWSAAQTLPVTAERIEIACAPSNSNYLYGLCENSSELGAVIRTTDGGITWTAASEPDDADTGIPNTDFTRGQAWYDLTLAVDPNNPLRLFVGGVDLFVTGDGASTWTQVSHWYGGFGFPEVHADQHYILFKQGSSSEAYFTNDGGIYYTSTANAATPVFENKGTNFITTQFYSCAIHPTASNYYFLGGAQDNGSHRFTTGSVQNTVQVSGGDGGFAHIDQDEPQYQFTAYTGNNFYRSGNGGISFTGVSSTGGRFINPSDYDDVNNRMYSARNSNEYLIWSDPQTGNSFTTVSVAAFGGQVSAVKVSPNTPNRVFFGANGDVFQVDNANTASPTVTNVSTGLPVGYLNCIEVQTGNDNHLLAVYTNYGINSIWESTNGGTSWASVEGNLPDMPVRWALLNPDNSDQAVIATDLGVWSTDDLDGPSTVWGASNSGLANVRVDMLQVRSSDKLVIAATHGRGMYYSDIFTNPTVIFDADTQLGYIGNTVNFANSSYKDVSWNWDFGDGQTSSVQSPSHTYNTAGKFNVTLTINGGAASVTKTALVHILPNKGTPYTPAAGGNFETNVDDFGSKAIRGGINLWERGVPGNFLTVVNSGVNAWKTDLDADIVQGDYACVLQTPNYNLTLPGTYTLRFRKSSEAVYSNAPWGVQVHYTTDKGLNWTRLGDCPDGLGTNWYNRGSCGTSLYSGIFTDGIGFLNSSNNVLSSYNISGLSGNGNVAFRFVFSVAAGFSASTYALDGFMIDDFEITGPTNVILPATLLRFKAAKDNNSVLLKWDTENEQNVMHYIVERSTDGQHFSPVGTVNARNRVSNSYTFNDNLLTLTSKPQGQLYYRLKIVDADSHFKYSLIERLVFETPVTTIIGPNPFVDKLFIYSPAIVKKITLTDGNGKVVFRSQSVPGNILYLGNKLAAGNYIAIIETDKGTEVRKLFKAE